MAKIEKLYYRALKYVFNNFSAAYTELHEGLNIPLLYVNRLKMILHEVYKHINKCHTRAKLKLKHNHFNYVKICQRKLFLSWCCIME